MYTRIFYLSALASLVAAHGTITEIRGANGITSNAMGIDTTTPRDGTRANPFQRDTSVIRDREIQSGKVGPCGRTNQKGALDMAAEMEAASSAGLPSADENGEIQMTLHQVNQDGAGPYTCDVSGDGGNTFQRATVTKNVPGAILGLSTATAEDFPLNVRMPAGMDCAGGPNGDACVVRCRNATPAGPFGSCAVVTSANAGGAQKQAAAAAAPEGAAKKPAAAPAKAAKPAKAATPAAGEETQKKGAAGALGALGGLGDLGKLIPIRRAYLNRLPARALAGPEDFADEDAKDAALEEKLISELQNGQTPQVEKKRVVRSRVAGPLAGYWI